MAFFCIIFLAYFILSLCYKYKNGSHMYSKYFQLFFYLAECILIMQ